MEDEEGWDPLGNDRDFLLCDLLSQVERWNCTLRQRLGRFVREMLSFSKSIRMHIICLDLFLHRYNRDRAAILLG